MSATPSPRAHQSGPKTNRLAEETSPYLLQHATNPVDWHPWSEEALARARSENKPIFLSIGYSACHWCHVMERESFENPSIAALMNELFVNIKVDREERPDIDHIYMSAVMAMTGHGGWPMSVFLTPSLEPFFGGTYFPPEDSRGMAGFPRVLQSVHRAWRERESEILETAKAMTDQLRAFAEPPQGSAPLAPELLDQAVKVLLRGFDPVHGGFGRAPKFPRPMDVRMLLRGWARSGQAAALNAVRITLDKMGRGGIYDHLGGGFARYATDDRWLVPHFEKMLYDNALLASTYLEAHQTTREPEYARIARETLDYILSRMTDDRGGFLSTEDADSEGVEGKYYVWSQAEVLEVLGAEAGATFCQVYDVTGSGNWEGKSILNLPRPIEELAPVLGREEGSLRAELATSRALLLARRETRIPPAKDTKVLASWNGLAIAALAEAGRILVDERFLHAAARAANFVLDQMRQPDGRLWHAYTDARARFNGCLDDYANMIDGLTRLFEADGSPRWLTSALSLAEIMLSEFEDKRRGGFFYTPERHESLITRPKDVHDNATPSGNGMAATALARLGRLASRGDFTLAAQRALEAAAYVLEHEPAAAAQSLIALDFLLGDGREIAVVAGGDPDEFRAVLEAISRPFLPGKVVAPRPADPAEAPPVVPLLENRPAVKGRATIYICKGSGCQPPIIGLSDLAAALEG